MKKKLLFAILLLSIFLCSSVTVVQPVRGYKFGVPEQAIGMEGEGEVKIYDKDEWKKHLGDDGDRPDDMWDGDSDIVGAKSKTKIKEFETDEDLIHFFWDHVLESDLDLDIFPPDDMAPPNPDPQVSTYKDAINYIDRAISQTTAAAPFGVYQACLGINAAGQGNATIYAIANASLYTYQNFAQGTTNVDEAQLLPGVDKAYDGTYVYTDNWDFYENADYPDKPDEKDAKGPFLADPRDLRDSYDKLVFLKTTLYQQLLGPNLAMGGYELNGTLYFTNYFQAYAAGDPATMVNLDLAVGGDGSLATIGTFMGTPAQVPRGIYDSFEELIPKKAGYLYLALEGGFPCYTPTEDYLAKMIEEFNINDENIETGHPAMEGSIPFKCDVDVEGLVVTMEFEYDDYLDPADTVVDYDNPVADPDPDELEDWEAVFTYNEYGTQDKVQYMDGDEIFYEKGGVDQIPGYEVTIIIGASALSILALIYVVMKKRKM
jgi:hypothetical protein